MKSIIYSISLLLLMMTIGIVFWGCAKMGGEKFENQAPTVNFVNTPPDANLDSTTSTWVQDMPFTIFASDSNLYNQAYQLVQFPQDTVWGHILTSFVVPNEPIFIRGLMDGDTFTYEINTDYVINDTATLEIKVIDPDLGGRMEALDITIDPISGDTTDIDTIVYWATFKLASPSFYVFNYAPTLCWFASDPDGFVDYYSYADINRVDIDNANTTPQGYISMIPPSAWVNTYSTSATLYLLSEVDSTYEHVVYLRCFDNDGLSSPIIYRTFFRSNEPPNVPEIKWDEQTDDKFATVNDIRTDSLPGQNYFYNNTLFCLPEITPIWNGIILRWRGTDPDDRELYTIPLTFMYFLITIDENDNPVDTVWEWSTYNPFTGQTYYIDEQSITLVGLESGSYMFSVWSYDDGFENSPEPAELYFKCVAPPLEDEKNTIILYDETVNLPGLYELPNNALVDSFYINMLRKMDSLFIADYDYTIGDIYDTSGIQDVMYWNNSTGLISKMIPIEKLANYKMVIFYGEDHKMVSDIVYRTLRDLYFQRYLEAGGRLWVIGRCLFFTKFGENALLQFTDNELLNMMQVQQIYVYRWPSTTIPSEFIGAFNAVDFLDTLWTDQTKINSLIGIFPDTCLPEVDWMGRDEDATTLYYFNSITGGTTELAVDSGTGHVMDASDNPPYPGSPLYPMPNGYECWITVDYDNVVSVSSVVNLDKLPFGNGIGEIQTITSDDDIFVSYNYIDTVYEENAQVLSTPEATPNLCFIQTLHYDQDFDSSQGGYVHNVTRNSYGSVDPDNITLYEVQVEYPLDTVNLNDEDAYVLTAALGQFDPTPDSCAVEISKNYLLDVISVQNLTKSLNGSIIRRTGNVVIVGTAGTAWASSDDIRANIDYLEYWEPGDIVNVCYESDIYWEKGDQVLVNYTYNPMSEAHLKPCAIRYEYYEVYNYVFINLYYRSSVFSFPLYFMLNTDEDGDGIGRVDKIFLEMLDWFLDPEVHLGE